MAQIEEMNGFISPRLGIRFELKPSGLEIYRPDGQKFLTPVELAARAEQAQLEAEQAQVEARQAELEARQERQRAEILAQRLRELGINPDEL